jgi:hypothetical protein
MTNTLTTVTPYVAAKIVNAALSEHDVIDPKTDQIKIIPPQMMYTYARKGYISTTDKKINLEGEKGLQEWLQAYLTRLGVTFETEKSPEETVMGS